MPPDSDVSRTCSVRSPDACGAAAQKMLLCVMSASTSARHPRSCHQRRGRHRAHNFGVHQKGVPSTPRRPATGILRKANLVSEVSVWVRCAHQTGRGWRRGCWVGCGASVVFSRRRTHTAEQGKHP